MNIWHIPLLLKEQKAHEAILKGLNLQDLTVEPILVEWIAMARLCDTLNEPVKIAMVGKYTGLSDSYLSVLKALLHASVDWHRKLVVEWVPAADLEVSTAEEAPSAYQTAWNLLRAADGILVPGGFGDRGVEGKILAARYARENNVPFLGICLGMHIAVIEFARTVKNLPDANSTEFNPHTANPCVIFMPEGSKSKMGGTMRLGSRRTYFQDTNCTSAKLYGNANYVDERHRHRYEINPYMVKELEREGLSFVGRDESGSRMEILELPTHSYFIGVQFHPEFKSRPGKPSALFSGLIAASCGQLDALIERNKNVADKFTASGSPASNGHLSRTGHTVNSFVSLPKAYENGNAKNKTVKSLVNGNFSTNGNGVYI